MTHLNEDELLQHALDLEDDPATRAGAEAHISSCQSCSGQLERIRGELAIISDVRLTKHRQSLPRRHPGHSIRLSLGVAALVVLSFAAGYFTSELVEHKPASVLPSTLEPTSPDPSQAPHARSDATQVTYPEAVLTAPGIR